jgi:hypothetical protein
MVEIGELKRLIRFYERRGWDPSVAIEFFVRKANRSLPWQERQTYFARSRLRGVGRPRETANG